MPETKLRALWRVSLLITAAAALQGCSGAHAKPDACKLIDPTAAAKVLGAKVTVKPINNSAAGKDAVSLCDYQTSSVTVELVAERFKTDDVAAEVARMKLSAANSTSAPGPNFPKRKASSVPDLGDAALLVQWGPVSGQVFGLTVFAHGDEIMLNRFSAPTPKSVRQTEALARIAVANLP